MFAHFLYLSKTLFFAAIHGSVFDLPRTAMKQRDVSGLFHSYDIESQLMRAFYWSG
jgi:hypothetical protein